MSEITSEERVGLMRAQALQELSCPSCVGPLESVYSGAGAVEITALRCVGEGLRFPVFGGVPMLIRPDRIARVESFAASYSRAWEKDGWGCPDESYLLHLPYHDTSRRRATEWRVKARSMETLLQILSS